MIERQRRIEWIQSVEREYRVGLAAARLLDNALRANPSMGSDEGWEKSDAENFKRNLESTFVIRLFAEFEDGLRKYWIIVRKRGAKPRTRDLLNGVASKCAIPYAQLLEIHEVRELRNNCVHEREEPVEQLDMSQVKGRIRRFLSYLPLDW